MAAKVFSLIIVLLGLSCLATARKCPATPKTCQIEYEDYPAPPTCETYIDENGQEQQRCPSIGTALFLGILDKTTSSLSESFGISKITFTGNCKCTLTLWSEDDLQGESKVHTLQNGETSFMTSDIWDQENASFEVDCNF